MTLTAVMFLDPFMIFMPMTLLYTLAALLVIGFGGFAALLWRESGGDERQIMHRGQANRLGYFVAVGLIILVLLYQVIIEHSANTWLVVILSVSVLSKSLYAWWLETYR